MYDVIVVGARCAGAPLAMLLARGGHRVLLADRAHFPSDTMSTHFMQPAELVQLREWGLLDVLLATGCPPCATVATHRGDFLLAGTPPLPDGVAAYAPRRTILDKLLVDAAVAAGAELREGFTIDDLVWEENRVAGVVGRSGGRATRERARVVVGADGCYSRVARLVGAARYDTVPCQTCTYYAYWEGVAVSGFEAYLLADPALNILLFPTHDGAICSFIQWPLAAFPRVRTDVEGSVRAAFAAIPGLAERFATARPIGRFAGTADRDNYFRVPHGPGWALVGDAGYYRDPRTAMGIKDAFQSAATLAAALDAGLTGRLPLDVALADYHRERDAAVRPGYESTLRAIRFAPPDPDEWRLRAALRGNQADTDQYCGLVIDTTDPEAFFAPANLARITQHAASVSV
ncbi:MAG TPA: NAD(P)/FAD-dependent oxidoreductase [Thermomicrobiales bacterium]